MLLTTDQIEIKWKYRYKKPLEEFTLEELNVYSEKISKISDKLKDHLQDIRNITFKLVNGYCPYLLCESLPINEKHHPKCPNLNKSN